MTVRNCIGRQIVGAVKVTNALITAGAFISSVSLSALLGEQIKAKVKPSQLRDFGISMTTATISSVLIWGAFTLGQTMKALAGINCAINCDGCSDEKETTEEPSTEDETQEAEDSSRV